MESSQKRSLLLRMKVGMAMSFILATTCRVLCSVGMKLRGQVGVYLTKERW